MKERNRNQKSKTNNCLLRSNVTVSAMLSVILQGMFWMLQIMSYLTLKVWYCPMVSTLGRHPGISAKKKSSPNLSHYWAQFLHHSASSVEQRTALKTRLADLAHLYGDSTIDSRVFTMHKECFCAINTLRKNDDIIIIKPNKGSGVILFKQKQLRR